MPPDEFDSAERPPGSTEPGCGVFESRALVAPMPLVESAERTARYRSAPFLAQLVATKDRHPQTRERGRAEPAMASAAYRAAAALTAA
jgi:hypothetical protein